MTLAATLVALAAAELGVKESGGNNLGPRIAEYQAATILAPGAWPWCAAFCAFVLRNALNTGAGRDYLRGAAAEVWRCKSALAFGWIDWAQRHGLLIFDEHDTRHQPQAGDFMVFDFSHIGIVEHAVAGPDGAVKLVETIEGNTGPKGLRDSDAIDGVLRKTRKASLCKAYIRLAPAGATA